MSWMIGISDPRNIAVAENRASNIGQLQSVLHGVGMIGEPETVPTMSSPIRMTV